MSVSEASSFRSSDVTVYATHAPSGLMRGSLTVFSSKMSSGCRARRCCAPRGMSVDRDNASPAITAIVIRLVMAVPQPSFWLSSAVAVAFFGRLDFLPPALFFGLAAVARDARGDAAASARGGRMRVRDAAAV